MFLNKWWVCPTKINFIPFFSDVSVSEVFGMHIGSQRYVLCDKRFCLMIQVLVEFCMYIIIFTLGLGSGASRHRVYGCQKTISTNFPASCLPSFLNAIVIRMWVHKILMASIRHGLDAQFISSCCTVSILRAHWHRYQT